MCIQYIGSNGEPLNVWGYCSVLDGTRVYMYVGISL